MFRKLIKSLEKQQENIDDNDIINSVAHFLW